MEKAEKKYNKLAELAILLFVIETTVDGTGRLIDFGFISIQMILFALACLATLNPLFCDFKRTMANPCVISAIVFGIAVVIWAYIGFKRENETVYIRQDITSVMTFLLLPGFLATVSEKRSLNKVVAVFYCAIASAGAVVTVLYCILPCLSYDSLQTLNVILERAGANMAKGRSFWRISALYIPGLVIGLNYLRSVRGAKRALVYLAEGFMLFGLFISVTRSVWLGLAVSAVLLAVLTPREIGTYLKNGLAILTVFALLVAVASLCYGEFAVIPQAFGRIAETGVSQVEDYAEDIETRLAESEAKSATPSHDADDTRTEELIDNKQYLLETLGSDNLRKLIISRHMKFIKQYFWNGAGLGFKMGKEWGGKSEYMYFDFLQKMGIFGFLTFLAAFFMPVVLYFKNGAACKHQGSEMSSYLLSGYLGLAVVSAFNPYLTNPMGIMILCMLAASITIEPAKA